MTKTVWYVMYFRFCVWRHVYRYWSKLCKYICIMCCRTSAIFGRCLYNCFLLTLLRHINGKLVDVAVYRCSSFGHQDSYLRETRC